MKVVVGVTGGIAAYKAAEVVRCLIKAGCAVQVIMTEGAKAFVMPLTFQALTGKPVRDSLLDPAAEMGMGHIELARWADAIVVAPASANSIARMAAGMSDDLLTTVILASRAPLWIAPAMNMVMWDSPLTQHNLRSLIEFRGNVELLGPASGEQACGDVGFGRMMEPESLVAAFLSSFTSVANLMVLNLRVVITAGPTRERLDPVRFLSNDSSGKMGFALAAAFAKSGAKVTLVSGPVQLATPADVTRYDVESAREMQSAVMQCVEKGCDIFIATAAVADYRPVQVKDQKIKKTDNSGLTLVLEQNPDILAGVACLPSPPFTVGFAAETENVEAYARAKLLKKNLKMVIGNNVSRQDIGFNSEHNEALVITPGASKALPKQLKSALAEVLLEEIATQYKLSHQESASNNSVV